jgi:hypothetical protein
MHEKLIEIETPRGRGILEKFWISDLNFIMAKIYFPDKKVWVNYVLDVNTPDNFIQKTFDEKTKLKEDT